MKKIIAMMAIMAFSFGAMANSHEGGKHKKKDKMHRNQKMHEEKADSGKPKEEAPKQ